jgi:hypothetical protein
MLYDQSGRSLLGSWLQVQTTMHAAPMQVHPLRQTVCSWHVACSVFAYVPGVKYDGEGSNNSDTSNNGRRVRRAAHRRMRHRGPCQPVAAEPLRRRHRPRCCTRCRKRPSNRPAGTLISRARRDPSGLVCSNTTQSDQSLALRVRCTVLRLSCVMIPESCLNLEGWAATNGGRSGEVPSSSIIHTWGATCKQ